MPEERQQWSMPIDIHVHPVNRPSVEESERQRSDGAVLSAAKPTPQDPEGFYQYYKERDMMAVLLVSGPVKDPRRRAQPQRLAKELKWTPPGHLHRFVASTPSRASLPVA